ncbi:ATP-dependent RNA helicase [Entomospira entomophila]|uniref:RNA helicase n=1 Tax=Entomospira entomophila TaxID=2719988 RepID=A0A968KRC5_9SPIO|nr:ATP-dependent RNA helicase [Entomospira entomophilus]NIZ40634.1 ATP-dependent RNA helicase [Entomospira entomophilus]WDI34848.1 ATP-dependent RNA helicase [Entomospira entomophilus]
MKTHLLPVYQHREKILHALKDHSVVIVESPTGSGKTTQIPIILHEAGYDAQGIIGVTQPRRIATLGVSDFIAKQLRVVLGEFVGYKMRFEDKTSPRTRIKIMTDGILLQELKNDHLLSAYSVIIIDEAHERSLNIDFILGLLKKILGERSDLKVIISSATINAQVFSRYFNHAPVISIDTPTYPVTVVYDPPESDTEEALIAKILERVETIISTDRKAGDILIFLPGERAIKLCMQALQGSTVHKKLWILPLYGMLAKEEQERVFKRAPFGKSKIVIATNIAETSITIDGIRTVIDSGLLKENIYNQRTYTNSLVQDFVSKAAAEQRKGRAGRTAPGTCYRLYSKEIFSQRPPFSKEEIFRTDLSEVVLRMAGLGVKRFVEFDFINKPSAAGVASGVETLVFLGAIDENREITKTGERLLQLPLLPRHGRILVESIMKYPDVVVECTIACAFLSTNNPYLLPLGEEVEARVAHQNFQDEAGDFIGYLHLYKAFSESETKEAFCQQNYLDLRTMQEIVNVKEQLESIIHDMGAVVGSGGSLKDYLMCCMAGLIQFVCVQTGHNLYRSLTTDRIMIHPGSVLFRQSPPFILAGEIVKTTRMYARSVSKIEKAWIEELDPALWNGLKAFVKPQMRGDRASTKQTREKKESQEEGITFGKLHFKVEGHKGKKATIALDWQAIWDSQQQATPTIPEVRIKKGTRATIMLGKEKILSGISVSLALQYMMASNPKRSLQKQWHRFPAYYPSPDTIQEELPRFLDNAQHLGELCLSKKGNVLGFLTIVLDKSGKLYFKPSLKFSAFLFHTQEALEHLDDLLLIKDSDPQSLELNRVFDRLTTFLSMD